MPIIAVSITKRDTKNSFVPRSVFTLLARNIGQLSWIWNMTNPIGVGKFHVLLQYIGALTPLNGLAGKQVKA